jgi:ATP-dependent helicase/nuclease subunit A
MTQDTFSADYTNAVFMQNEAADPLHSVFVSANAGSGKTRVLVNRVSRILLSGTGKDRIEPDKILCLTYTKAAASEMQTRLFETLGAWSVMGDGNLTKALAELDGQDRPRSAKELARARRLFVRALETPGGLKVQTIHAFCERVLKQFPLEAGLRPGTEALDGPEATLIYEQIWRDIEQSAVHNPDSPLAKAISLLAVHKNDDDLNTLYIWMLQNAYKIDAWHKAGGITLLATHFGIDADMDEDECRRQAWALAPQEKLKRAAQDMLIGNKGDKTKAKHIVMALESSDALNAYDHYSRMFFTAAGKPIAQMVTGKAGDMAIALFGNKKDEHGPEALRMVAAQEQIKKIKVLSLTKAVYDVAHACAAQYRAVKTRRRLIDFDDQIQLTRRLLVDSEARDWVRYKLDGGVSHILVDEAQDTSALQWDIIEALSDEFFQPNPNANPLLPRTLFAVGDEKQSIYSFQGADPELFLEKIQRLTHIQTNTPEVKMAMSFRSTRHVLTLVDQIFTHDKAVLEMFNAEIFVPGSDLGKHTAHREDAGYIELWPAAQKADKPEETSWKPVPVDQSSAGDAREQLAFHIARHIKELLDNETTIIDKKTKQLRLLQPRDILILVGKRTSFFDGVIRNLKTQGVPVAGADKISLNDALAVQDLLSLAKFTLLTSDDLSLAEVLKSPLFGWDDDKLFALAYGRSSSLWAALTHNAAYNQETRILRHLISMSQRFAPYEFFARTLSLVPKDKSNDSILQKFYNRLGHECADALDGFLARALSHQRRGAPSLSAFVSEIQKDEQKISRTMDGEQNEVRVMTVHGAKGLEAPLVILPDTTQSPRKTDNAMLALDEKAKDGFVFNISAADTPKALSAVKDALHLKAKRESLRLLYVALTRAENRLIICGFRSNNKVAEDSWHARIQHALEGIEGTQPCDTPFGEGLSFGTQPELEVRAQHDNANEDESEMPKWAREMPQKQEAMDRIFTPSKLHTSTMSSLPPVAVRSPLFALNVDDTGLLGPEALGLYGRGNIIHKLLQILPALPRGERQNAAQHYVHSQRIDAHLSEDILREVFTVLADERFAHVFDENAQAEVSIVGRAPEFPKGTQFNGQIDRLAVQDDRVLIVDYKSNRPPPKTLDGVPQLYIHQMAAYRALVREMYPGKPVHTALLWTHAPVLMPLPNALLDNVNWADVLTS